MIKKERMAVLREMAEECMFPVKIPTYELRELLDAIESADKRAYDTVIPALDRLQDMLNASCHLIKRDATTYALLDMNTIIASGKTVRELMVNLVMVDC